MNHAPHHFQLEGHYAVHLAAGELRIAGPHGRLYFGARKLRGLGIDRIEPTRHGLEIHWSLNAARLLLLDPVVALMDQVYGVQARPLSGIISSQPTLRANRMQAAHSAAGTVITYRRTDYGASLVLEPRITVHRDPRGGYLLTGDSPLRGRLTVASSAPVRTPHLQSLPLVSNRTSHIAFIDSAIRYLFAAERPHATLQVAGGWLLAAEAAVGELSPDDVAWLVGRAIDEIPQLPASPLQLPAEGLSGLAAATDVASRHIRLLARAAADRELYRQLLGARIRQAAAGAEGRLTTHQLRKLSTLPYSQLAHLDDIPPVMRPGRFHTAVSYRPATFEPALSDSLDSLSLWSLLRARSIIRTYLNQKAQ